MKICHFLLVKDCMYSCKKLEKQQKRQDPKTRVKALRVRGATGIAARGEWTKAVPRGLMDLELLI